MPLKTLTNCYDPMEAHILRARLEAEGIPATVADDQHVTANWPLSVALGGARVQVPAEFEAQAEAVLRAYHDGDYEQALAEETGLPADACPACGSTAIDHRVPVRQKALAIGVFLLGSATFPTRSSAARCDGCGHEWTRE